ncbi:MAG: GTPase Era [Burkholderiales bacterium]|nr:GTPase Era [Burkholderiales bacterium]
MSAFRCGTVGIAGRPNVGKSSLVNRLVGQKLSIVSPKAQTTRHLITAILTTEDAQLVFIDAPGRPPRARSALQRMLGRRAAEAARDCDVALLVLEAMRLEPGDHAAVRAIPARQKTVAAVNKIDRVQGAERLLPFIERVARLRTFEAVVPVSARTGRNLPTLLRVLRATLPEGPALYPADQLTDRDERFFAAELLREKLFYALGEELPYRCEVMIDSFRMDGALRRVDATILVERESQKGIVVGRGGAALKRVAAEARRDMERLFGGKVFLNVWVKVRDRWTDDVRVLHRLGYA